jgi:N-methylhydantoinase A
VGPLSAGADPGPICYGKGERITVTDANLFLGRLIPNHFLGGAMKLRRERLDKYFERMGAQANLSALDLAEGILSVANTAMERAIRVISVERGFDPREFTLFSFGGAGAMHAAFLAKLLSIPKVLVPRDPGILSAIGMLMADVIKDYSVTVMLSQHDLDMERLHERFNLLMEKGFRDLTAEGISPESVVMEKYLDMRYTGQSYEIMAPFDGDVIEGFHMLHEKQYGYRNPEGLVEIVNIRLRARGAADRQDVSPAPYGSSQLDSQAILGEANVVFDQATHVCKVIAREKLAPGNTAPGPAVIVEYSSTMVIPPFASGRVDGYGNVILDIT